MIRDLKNESKDKNSKFNMVESKNYSASPNKNQNQSELKGGSNLFNN
jgi:hypothetical protein